VAGFIIQYYIICFWLPKLLLTIIVVMVVIVTNFNCSI